MFGKNKEKDDAVKEKENNSGQKDEREKRPSGVKKIKDINSVNRKRRKEPIRKWTRFDRILVFILLLLTVGGSLFLTISSRGYKLPEFSQIKIPKFNLFGERTIILESNSDDKKRAQELMDGFDLLTKDLTGTYGIYLLDLNGSFTFGVNENEIFTAEPLLPLPVMVGMYLEEEGGRLNLDTVYELKAKDRVKGLGSLYGKPVGYKLTYREIMKLMGKESDYTALNICRNYLGDEKVQNIIDKTEMLDTSLEMNETTSKDIGLFFYKLWNYQLINEKNTEELLNNLTDTKYGEWLVSGAPEDVLVTHAFGRGLNGVSDAGIIYADNPYIAVIMSKNVIISEADKVFPQVSEMVYRSLNK